MATIITIIAQRRTLVDVCPTDCIHPKKDEPEFEAATQMYVTRRAASMRSLRAACGSTQSSWPMKSRKDKKEVHREERRLLQK